MKKIITISALLLVSILVKAQWTNNVALNTMVRDSVGTEESTPLSATRSDGSTYISFFEMYNGNYQLRMQLLDNSGYKLWPGEGLIISSFQQNSALFRYDLKVDKEDNAIVAFQDERTAGALNVVAYKIDGTGNFAWGANGIQLIDPVSAEGLAPNIGITNSNNVIIAWTADNGSAKYIPFQKISPTGTVMWPNVRRIIDSSNVNRYSRPTMVPYSIDDFVMLYARETGSGFPPTSYMFAQHYDANGAGVWAAPVQVSTKNIPFFFFQKAVSDRDGGFYVAFNAAMQSNPMQTDVYVQHVDAAGTLWNATGNVACALGSSQHFTPASRYDDVHNKFWVLLQVTDVNQNDCGAYVQKIDSAGNVLLTANGAQLIAVSSTYYNPNDFTITSDGVITICTVGSSTLSQTLVAVKNDFSGNLMWGGNPLTVCSAVAGKDDLSTGIFTQNQVVIVWDDNRNDYGVYAQNITNEGTFGIVTSIAEINTENAFSIYPNPFDNEITISNLKPVGEEFLEIYNVLGEKVYEQELNAQGVNMPLTIRLGNEQLVPGIYFIKAGNCVAKAEKR